MCAWEGQQQGGGVAGRCLHPAAVRQAAASETEDHMRTHLHRRVLERHRVALLVSANHHIVLQLGGDGVERPWQLGGARRSRIKGSSQAAAVMLGACQQAQRTQTAGALPADARAAPSLCTPSAAHVCWTCPAQPWSALPWLAPSAGYNYPGPNHVSMLGLPERSIQTARPVTSRLAILRGSGVHSKPKAVQAAWAGSSEVHQSSSWCPSGSRARRCRNSLRSASQLPANTERQWLAPQVNDL